MVGPKLETNKGTDQPWARPGNFAQNRKKGPSREQRSKEYEGLNDPDQSGYPRPSDQKGRSNEPVRATGNLNAEGRVGDPLPLLLLAIVFIPILAAIAGVAWFWLR